MSGGPIRTLSISLLAVAAIATSVVVAKQRGDGPTSGDEAPAGETVPAQQSLDAIREAGL